MQNPVETPDWSVLPAPIDDGATRHLTGMRMPSVALRATDGRFIDLAAQPGWAVIYAYACFQIIDNVIYPSSTAHLPNDWVAM